MENHVKNVLEAAEMGNLSKIQMYARKKTLKVEDSRKWTPLHAAVRGNQEDIVRFCISKKISVNSRTFDQVTPLHIAAQTGNELILYFLIENGAIIDALDSEGRTPLHYGVIANRESSVRLLLELGANPNILDNKGFGPIHSAIELPSIPILEMLVEGGAKVSLTKVSKKKFKVPNYWSPIHVAAYHQQLDAIQYLYDHGADINGYDQHKNKIGTTLHLIAQYDYPQTLNLLLKLGANIEALDLDDDTPLLISVRHHLISNVKLLMNQRNINKANNKKETPLHLSCSTGDTEITLILLENGADPNLQDNSGNTPLHLAVKAKSKECVSFLLDKNASITIKNNEGRSPFSMASGEIAKMMKELVRKNGSVKFQCPPNSAQTSRGASRPASQCSNRSQNTNKSANKDQDDNLSVASNVSKQSKISKTSNISKVSQLSKGSKIVKIEEKPYIEQIEDDITQMINNTKEEMSNMFKNVQNIIDLIKKDFNLDNENIPEEEECISNEFVSDNE